MIAGDDDGSQGLSVRVGAVEGNITNIKSTLESVIQELKIFSLKIDDQSLTEGTYQNKLDLQSTKLSPPPPPSHPP